MRFGPLIATACLAATACSGDGGTPPSATPTSAPTARPTWATSAPAASTSTTFSRSSAGCDEPAAPAGLTDRTMMSGGVERMFRLVVPDGYDGRTALPVVFGLHALTVSHLAVPSISGYDEMATRYDFIAVYPSGRLNGTTPYWLAAPVPGNHDVRFVGELLDLLETELCIDPARVFAAGMSNGGQMSSVLACQLADRITAVAPISGVEFSDSCRGRPVPVMAFHGDADPIVHYDGGGLNATRITDMNYWHGEVPAGLPEHEGVEAAMRNWARHNGCDPEPLEVRLSPEVVRRTWERCDADTILYVVEGGGHAWPGKPFPQFEASFGHGTDDIDATTLMFEFFFEQMLRR